ncbi:MAG: hypothetical protein CBB87_05775 [Micavibrio sp. TMED27]|nr:hypothetical protein [Micavibrio sp.]OUT91526.1 MAG: hypothetical protein CBB87_05775 [Micavibrio sp. TMED27]|tara:strand:- start:1302 stop:1691 length:390 start_codon:yes stop_codon:yes gene_type:complete
MSQEITLDDLQGMYDVTYASSPQLENFYEPGFGSAKVENNTLTGVDALGVIWNAEFSTPKNGEMSFKALLDPKDTPPTVGLMNANGVMTREPQNYSGIVKITKLGEELILRTQVQQGPITIDVQFRKKS